MRTKLDNPKDPKCRPWNAKENARRAKQRGLGLAVNASEAAEERAANFRAEKAARWPAQEAADLKEYKRYSEEQDRLKASVNEPKPGDKASTDADKSS